MRVEYIHFLNFPLQVQFIHVVYGQHIYVFPRMPSFHHVLYNPPLWYSIIPASNNNIQNVTVVISA